MIGISHIWWGTRSAKTNTKKQHSLCVQWLFDRSRFDRNSEGLKRNTWRRNGWTSLPPNRTAFYRDRLLIMKKYRTALQCIVFGYDTDHVANLFWVRRPSQFPNVTVSLLFCYLRTRHVQYVQTRFQYRNQSRIRISRSERDFSEPQDACSLPDKNGVRWFQMVLLDPSMKWT